MANDRSKKLFESLNIKITPEEMSIDSLEDYVIVKHFLTEYKPPSDDNLKKVNGYLNAFDHLIDAKDWLRARDVIRFKLNDENHVELCDQIAIWGNYSKALKYYEKIIGNIDADTDVFCLNGMASIYGNLNEFEKGIKYGEKGLEKAKEIDNISIAAQLACNIAWCYRSLGKYTQATELYNESLDLARMSNNKFVEARALDGLSTVNLYLKDYDRAIYYGYASLQVAESDDNLLAKTSSFLILGISYLSKNNYEQAIQYTQEGVNLACQSDAPCNKAWGYCNFGKIYFKMEKYEEAEKYLQESLDIFNELGNYRGQTEVLETLSKVFKNQGMISKAEEMHDLALNICIKVGIPLVVPI